MAVHLETGRRGEEIAVLYLKTLGYRIDGMNVRLGRDELDIIAFDPKENVLVFIEVKSRTKNLEDFSPLLGMTHGKRQRIQRAAHKWIWEKDFDGAYRMDIVTVAEGKVLDHIQDIEWLG